ncbi:MAG: DUF2088 domain-containing protein [Firmicutes bacterium]|nr:DUF2088 domain-containing protein [Bacillota bacterium]
MDKCSVASVLRTWVDSLDKMPKYVLLLPPDFTRFNSQAGLIVQELYTLLSDSASIDIMPALGTHRPMMDGELTTMFGSKIPPECYIKHDWRRDVVNVGEIPSEFVHRISEGLLDYSINVEINERLLDPKYDVIVSIGQVVPHEVAGMANYTKNVLVGCGGKDMIDKSHFLGAVYGMEHLMGQDHSPVRQVFDYGQKHFLSDLPLHYILTVTTTEGQDTTMEGIFVGKDRSVFEEAVALSQSKNLDFLDKPLKKVVVYLDPNHFQSTWLGNKAIYRLRMAIQDQGELLILAPGVKQFGEDPTVDKLIRKYGYRGTPYTLNMVDKNTDLNGNLAAAAHLIHGSSEGRFKIIYSPGELTREEIEAVGYDYMDLDEALAIYNPDEMKDGFNLIKGEWVFFVSNPALGLWALRQHRP